MGFEVLNFGFGIFGLKIRFWDSVFGFGVWYLGFGILDFGI